MRVRDARHQAWVGGAKRGELAPIFEFLRLNCCGLISSLRAFKRGADLQPPSSDVATAKAPEHEGAGLAPRPKGCGSASPVSWVQITTPRPRPVASDAVARQAFRRGPTHCETAFPDGKGKAAGRRIRSRLSNRAAENRLGPHALGKPNRGAHRGRSHALREGAPEACVGSGPLGRRGMTHFDAQRDDLSRLADQARLRRLQPQAGADFSSNDYLGLAGSERMADAVRAALDRGVPVGSGGSRLLRGNHEEHEALEAEAAAFFGSESALYFSSGYGANAALLSTLPQTGDLILFDALIHASAHEGMKLGRAHALSVNHNDVSAFEDALLAWRRQGGLGRPWIVVESLYSMDGDPAPLADLAALADRYEAVMLIDEAHATGVFGQGGRGLAADLEGRDNVITLRTCGKALGCEGALVCGPALVRDFLINRGRGFIFSTAPSPLMAAAVRAAIGVLRDEPERRDRLWALVQAAETRLGPHGAAASGSPIMPLIIGDEARTMVAAARLQAAGYDVRGVRPPTVPRGTSRLRISVTLNVTAQDIAALAGALGAAIGRVDFAS